VPRRREERRARHHPLDLVDEAVEQDVLDRVFVHEGHHLRGLLAHAHEPAGELLDAPAAAPLGQVCERGAIQIVRGRSASRDVGAREHDAVTREGEQRRIELPVRRDLAVKDRLLGARDRRRSQDRQHVLEGHESSYVPSQGCHSIE
jgi:hypothetical protein